MRLKAKMKVRYAALLCFVGLIGTYAGFNITQSSSEKSLDSIPKNHKNEGDITRRSFTGKWHDGRGLLNEISETKKNENVRAKFVQHLAEDALLERESMHRERLVGREEDVISENEDGVKESNVRLSEPEEFTTNAPDQETILRSKGKVNSERQAFEESNHAVRITRQNDRIVQEHVETELHITQEQREKKESLARRGLGKLSIEKPKPREKYITKKVVKTNKYQTHQVFTQNQILPSAHQKENIATADDVVADVTKSNRTIFDPSDHVITYEILHDNEDFTKTLLDDDRRHDSYWGDGFPITPREAIRRYGDQLPAWEKFEIMHYPKIFFLGLGANKTRLTTNATENFGYDYFHHGEEEGHYKVVPGDHVGYRYEIIKFLGSGTFGAVALARDWSQPMVRNVALKIMHYDENDKYIIREMNMMKVIEKNATNRDYFSRLLATFDFRNHKCLVMELLGKSLHRRGFGPVTDMSVFRRYAHDILMGLHHLKELNMVHADMKPANIMFLYGKNNESAGQLLKVADFGIGCIPGDKRKSPGLDGIPSFLLHFFKCPSHYVQTRYYRAPEVIFAVGITTAVDMFSVGVIFSEFFLGFPPFFGETETDHLAAMMEVLGLPPTYMIAKSSRKKVYQRAICYETKNGFKRKPYRKPLWKVLRGIDPELFDLIARCLEYDPKLRITPEEALKHPFVTGVKPKEQLKTPISIQRFHGKI